MPKRPRRAHVPKQQAKHKPRRSLAPAGPPSAPPASAFVQEPAAEGLQPSAADGAGRPLRRLEQLRATREHAHPGSRALPGQLPTFERAYLVGELQRIAVTAGALFVLLVLLAVLMR